MRILFFGFLLSNNLVIGVPPFDLVLATISCKTTQSSSLHVARGFLSAIELYEILSKKRKRKVIMNHLTIRFKYDWFQSESCVAKLFNTSKTGKGNCCSEMQYFTQTKYCGI